jgi:hypothetical protein
MSFVVTEKLSLYFVVTDTLSSDLVWFRNYVINVVTVLLCDLHYFCFNLLPLRVITVQNNSRR